jgi:hypothetical protein
MARIRTIKPEFPQSESMGRVSRDARLLFIQLWTICDDEGRSRGNSRMLASLLFPYDDDAPKLLDGWVKELEDEGCIDRYEVEGSTYIQIKKWQKHQKIDKPTASKLPQFVEDSREIGDNSRKVSEVPRKIVQEGNGPGEDLEGKGGERAQARDAPLENDFSRFWKSYPNQPADAEASALKAWNAAKKAGNLPPIADLLASLGRWKTARKREESPAFAPFAKTWLAEERWRDWPEPPAPKTEHTPDWADAYPVWSALKQSLTPCEWAPWLGQCKPNGAVHNLICPNGFVRDEVERRYGRRLEGMFDGTFTAKVIGQDLKSDQRST